MTQATTAAGTSQDALNGVLGGAMPSQGSWSDEHCLWLTDRTRRLVDFTDGGVEVLSRPTERHQSSCCSSIGCSTPSCGTLVTASS